jgi:Zn-dependent metalloprotease
MKQLTLKKLAFGFVVLVLLAFGIIIALAQDNSDPIDTIRAFMGDPRLELRAAPGTDSPQGLQTRNYSTLDGASTFSVDVQRHQVVLAILANTQSGGSGGISHDQALRAAQAFATSRVTEFQRMSLLQDSSGDHGTAGQQYSFLWAERLGTQQAIGLKRVAITVDAGSGTVLSFMQIPSSITVNVEPTVSRDQALAIAQKKFGAATISQSATLDVWWRNNDRTQPQVLRWTVKLDSNVPLDANAEANQLIFKHAAYIIDAHTGDIIEELN